MRKYTPWNSFDVWLHHGTLYIFIYIHANVCIAKSKIITYVSTHMHVPLSSDQEWYRIQSFLALPFPAAEMFVIHPLYYPCCKTFLHY